MKHKDSVIRVLVVDDDITFRERFCTVLMTDEKIKIVGSVATGREAVETAFKEVPDVILMDIMMEDDIAGIEAAHKINECLHNVKIIISTVLDDDETIFNAFQTGAVDYLLKNAQDEEIITAIRLAYHDQSPMRPMIARKIRKEFKKMRSYHDSIMYTMNTIRKLTQVELDILILLCEGKSRSDITQLRCVEMSTVKTHVRNLNKKFKKKNTHEIVIMLKEMQIIDLIRQWVDD